MIRKKGLRMHGGDAHRKKRAILEKNEAPPREHPHICAS